jgi:hypothetical protein
MLTTNIARRLGAVVVLKLPRKRDCPVTMEIV